MRVTVMEQASKQASKEGKDKGDKTSIQVFL